MVNLNPVQNSSHRAWARVFFWKKDKIYAVNSVCPHLKLPLKKGKITPDGAIVCPWHRSKFDLDTGEVKTWCPWPPAVGKLLGKVSTEQALTVFPTRIEDGQIAVQLPTKG